MGLPGKQTWTWTLYVLFCGMCVGQLVPEPHYMVAFPAVLEAGAETKFCVSLFQPNETLVLTVTLRSQERNTTLCEKTSSTEFHDCLQCQIPSVDKEDIWDIEVVVRGNTFYSREVRKVMINDYKPKTFIQTDKPIYLPGQTVHFRLVTLDSQLRPASQLYNLIELEDPYGNRIGQWLNETSNSKILQLSYSLNSEAREGSYKLITSTGGAQVSHHFKVEKYVLPKFDVTINVKDEVSVSEDEIDADICAKYTYGQSVPGSVTVKVCRPLQYYSAYGQPRNAEELGVTDPCDTQTKKTDKAGCAAFQFKMSTFTKLDQKVVQDKVEVSASVEEEDTGVSHQQKKSIRISYVLGKLSFVDTPKIYELGSNLEGKVKAVHHNDTPIPHMPLYLLIRKTWSTHLLLQNLTTDNDGFASFSISTDAFSGDATLYVSKSPSVGYSSYRTAFYEMGSHTVSLSQPPSPDTKSVSSLKLKKRDSPLSCDKEEDILIKYSFVQEPQDSVDIMFLVLSRGAIVFQGRKQVQVEDKSVNQGEMSFKLTVSPDMAPNVQIVAYAVLPSKNVIAHSADFDTEKCFSNKVLLDISPSPAVPGEQANMKVTAQPDSLCGVSAIDQSVLIKEAVTLDADKIFNLLPVKKVTNTPYKIWDRAECLHVRPKRYALPYPDEKTKDAHTVFQNIGLKMATNLALKMPSCLKFKGREYHQGHNGIAVDYVTRSRGMAGPPVPALGGNAGPLPTDITVRTFFPETWIWDLVEVGASGTKDVPLTVPDTITTWETETFCLSPQGFGLAPREKLTVFQPFFLELTLPYSIIRGENFELKATVFNYLSSCIMVKISPAPSSDFTLTPLSGDQYTSCLCGNERKTLRWIMAPTALGVVNVTVTAEAIPSHASCDNEIVSVPERGRIDVVTRSLIVKAEGIEVTKTHNWLLCPKGNTLTEETEIQLPGNVIEGSARATVSVLGDILGRALKNLDGLLQMPYGCGEQNMALLAPNIYILEYLQKTQQLTPAIKEKASNFLTSGYQRQLNYKDIAGAYSTFGSGPGNTWLTAFVLRSFHKAQSFIYIDETKMEASKTWLIERQNITGCFVQSGKLFNNRMKGGVSDEVTLSAYITAALLETNSSVNDPVVSRSLSCLREFTNDFSNTYTTALLAYVFTLAGDMETRAHLLQHLDSVAVKQGGFTYWSQTSSETSASLSVEISSYVLMAKLAFSQTAEDLGYASSIVRWLTTQQNHYGGFSSTQDTVVALQALALYSSAVFSPEGSSTVTVQSPSGPLVFDVNQENKLLYQEKLLQDVSGKNSLRVEGTTCASVQISVHYNIPPPPPVTSMRVEVKPEFDTSRKPKLTLKIMSLYNGNEISTNMVILDIALLSGFVPDPQSLENLKLSLLVDRVEHKDGHVVVYLEGLKKDVQINHSLELLQQIPVNNLKPAVIALYDYYQPSDRAEKEYTLTAEA
ncbi:alpha-2-macroglobulin-like [Nothobranchius furzeri]|uniref:alpha-2-macroglobulin-like n=1 Tax=Nothobranchius furzeri TaxID=105023 RepID=UPI00390477E4